MEIEKSKSLSKMEQPSRKPFQRKSSLQTVSRKQMHIKQRPSCSWRKKEPPPTPFPKVVIFSDSLPVLHTSPIAVENSQVEVPCCCVTHHTARRGLFVGCLTSQQRAGASLGRICSDNFTCYHTEIEVADQTIYLTQSQYTDTGPTILSADPIMPGAWQGSPWSANFKSLV